MWWLLLSVLVVVVVVTFGVGVAVAAVVVVVVVAVDVVVAVVVAFVVVSCVSERPCVHQLVACSLACISPFPPLGLSCSMFALEIS